MSYPINYPTPQSANVQIFSTPSINANPTATWIKPQGASFVWFTLIGAGGGGDGANGGGSGAVTNCMVPAFLIPDSLVVDVGAGGAYNNPGAASQVFYKQKNGTGYQLLIAQPGAPGASPGAASSSNYFSAMGFFQSVAGQSGSASTVSSSATTFLSGGSTAGNTTANYGYTTASKAGYFQLQPIIVGVGGGDSAAGYTTETGGIGCGGGIGGAGGNGLVVIITW